MEGTDTQVENPSPCHEQLFLSGLCLDSRVIQQVVDFFCVKIHHMKCCRDLDLLRYFF